MKNTKRKGFTIVELVIVIAVIAILAAVLIPTFASLVKKANQSSDIQAAKNMNTALIAESAGKEFTSLQDVLKALKASGIDADSHKALSDGYKFVWDSELNRILYVGPDNKVVYPDEYKEVAYKPEKWVNLTGERAGDDSWYKGENKGETLSDNQYTVGGTTLTLGTEVKKYTIENAYQLVSFAQIVKDDENNGANMVIELKEGATYDMLGAEWDVIPAFAGVFNGKGATIKNLAIKDTTLSYDDAELPSWTNQSYKPYAFISVFSGAYFGNVTFEVDIDSPGEVTTQNHTVAGAIGYVGAMEKGSTVVIEKVTMNGSIRAPFRAAGIVGFVGGVFENMMSGTVEIKDCVNNASVTSYLCTSSYCTAAGIVSTANQFNEDGKLVITGCKNTGAISGSDVAGIMANCFAAYGKGEKDNSDKEYTIIGTVEIYNNTNEGNITATHSDDNQGLTFVADQNCALAAGIVAPYIKQTQLYVYGNTNSGTVTATGSTSCNMTKNEKCGDSVFTDRYSTTAPSN